MRKNILARIFAVCIACALPFTTTGCANDPTLASDITGVVTTGLATAQDVFAIAAAVQQNNTGKTMNVSQVLSDAQAIVGTAKSTGLGSAGTDFVNSLNQTIANAKANGASSQQIINAVSAQVVAAQTATIAVAAPGSPATATAKFYVRDGKFVAVNTVASNKKV